MKLKILSSVVVLAVLGAISVAFIPGAAEALNKLTTIEVANWLGQAAPPVSVAGNATIYFNSSTKQLMLSQDGAAYATIDSGGATAATLPLVISAGNVKLGTATGPTTTDSNAAAIWDSSSAAKKTLVLQGMASQTANIFEIQQSDGTVVSAISLGSATYSGTNNTHFGSGAGAATPSGFSNSIFGYGAGASIATGGSNSIFGSGAGAALTSNGGNVLIGASAGSALDAPSNTMIGTGSGTTTTTGQLNTLVGSGSNTLTAGTNGAVAIGYGATASTSQFVAGSSSAPMSNVYFGKGASAAVPTAYTINGTASSVNGTNGEDVNLAPGIANQAADSSGSLRFKTAASGSGTTLTDKMVIAPSGLVTLTMPLGVASGGTGLNTATTYAPIFGGTTATGAFQSGTVGTATQVLTSNGPGLLPTFQAAAASGGLTVGTTTITSGATTRILYDNAGVLGEYSVIPASLFPALTGDVTNAAGTLATTIAAAAVTTAKLGLNARPIGNLIIDGGWDFAQRTTPGTLTSLSLVLGTDAYSADRWKTSAQNADVQYIRTDTNGASESGLVARYYGGYKKITNTGKFAVYQPIEGINTFPLAGRTVTFQIKLRLAASTGTVRLGLIQLNSSGTIDSIPPSLVPATWGADTVNPTFGANLALITPDAVPTGAQGSIRSSAVDCALTTTWQLFAGTFTMPSNASSLNAKNILPCVFTDSGVAANVIVYMGEAQFNDSVSIRDWLPRLNDQELSLCRYYFRKSYAMDQKPATNSITTGICAFYAGSAAATSQVIGMIQFGDAGMRVTPTITIYSYTSSTTAVVSDTIGTDKAANSGSVTSQSQNGFWVYNAASSQSMANNGTMFHYKADSEL